MTSTQPPKRKRETLENPLIGDKVTFIHTAAETGGRYTQVEVSLVAGGGNTHHYHTAFSETFEPLEGELTIGLGKTVQQFNPGDSVTAEPMESHFFANKTDQPIRFMVTLTPASAGFEEGLRIAYGLARDGETNKKGIPKKLSHLAILLVHTNTNIYGFFTLLAPFFKLAYKRAVRKGILQELQQRYCNTLKNV
jgi:quercetin dioxygenase-like cupin family protein